MAANQVAIRNYLVNVIGFPTPETALRVVNEGIDAFDTLAEFGDDDIKNLCSSLCKGGGFMNDPNHVPQDNTPHPQIADPGIHIPAILEKRLKAAAYGAKILTMIGRRVDANALTRLRLKRFLEFKDVIDKHEDEKDTVPTITKQYGIVKALDAFASMVQQKIGVHGVPLH